jgi:hypothetical protein
MPAEAGQRRLLTCCPAQPAGPGPGTGACCLGLAATGSSCALVSQAAGERGRGSISATPKLVSGARTVPDAGVSRSKSASAGVPSERLSLRGA